MPKFKVDLSNCDREPIHVPGAVQSWGFLVTVHTSSNLISYVSSNILDYLNITAGSILGKSVAAFQELLEVNQQGISLLTWVDQARAAKEAETYSVKINDIYFDVFVHHEESYIYLEFEAKENHSVADINSQIGRYVPKILSANHLQEILDTACIVVKELIGYDRVMVYQFMEDAHGKVVAEEKNENLQPFLNLHYPASDIPSQARALYKHNKIRLIADVYSKTSALLSLNDKPLDLTTSILRAVSPMHIQYLKNMGVASSFSISLTCKDELWGLIACHNYTPKMIDHKQREGAKLLGQIISSAVEFKEEETINTQQQNNKAVLDSLISNLRTEVDISQAVFSDSGSFLNIVEASGAYLRFEDQVLKDGTLPTDSQIELIIDWLYHNNAESIFKTTRLADLIPEAAEFGQVASGILVCTISRELKEYIIWFKPEYLQNISWAGNPEKPVEFNENGDWNISPRKSFESFNEILKLTTTRWKLYELNNAQRFKEELLYFINKKASEIRILNEKLKEAYDELDFFSTTISHDLKTPLSVIRGYAQLLERNRSLDEDGRQFAARISVSIAKMNMLIAEVLEYSRVGRSDIEFQPLNMTELIANIKQEMLAAFNSLDLHLEVKGTPSIKGDKTMIYQVFSNLINNAIKYSRLSKPVRVSITGTGDDNGVIYSISDNGIGIDPKNFSKVFELFRRVNVSEDFEGTGVGLAIVKRILDKHRAVIWIDSDLGRGSTFNIIFSKF